MDRTRKFLAGIQENVRVEEIAETVGVTPMRIRQLENMGVIQSFKDGRTRLYDKWPTLLSILKYYREKADSRRSGDSQEMKSAKERQATAKAKLEELKLAQLEGDLHKAEDIERIIGAILTRLRINLLAIPMGLAPVLRDMDDAMEIAEKLDERIRRVMNEVADMDLRKLVEGEPCGEKPGPDSGRS
jgi:phage terminase Nu1 subunit (DNA packaging protein)